MVVIMVEIIKFCKISGVGMMDCKNVLIEVNGDIDKVMEIICKKGQVVVVKCFDCEVFEGCVLVKKDGEFVVIIVLKCEIDFVVKNVDFVVLI